LVNPFDAKTPADPRHFANRGEILDFFMRTIRESAKSKSGRPDNIALLGNWGVGKTSTLYKFRDILKNELKNVTSFSTIFSIKPSCCANSDLFTISLLDNLSRDYEVSTPLKDKIKGIISEEIKFWEKWRIKALSTMGPGIERKEERITGISLVEVLTKFWKKLESKGVEIAVIMLDDIHYLLGSEWKGSFYDLRTDIQALSTKGCRYMFVITGPTLLYPEIRQVAEPFTRLFERYELGPFDFDGTKELILKPLKVERIPLEVSEDTIKRIHEISGGHPFFTTLIMRDLLYKYESGRIGGKEFNKALPDIMQHLGKARFEGDLEKATDAEKKVLLKIAKFDRETVSPSDINGEAKLLERLVKKDLITKLGRGQYKLYHPLFKQYLKNLKT
jgi:hypothetical protein